jgi:hypothetical protein
MNHQDERARSLGVDADAQGAVSPSQSVPIAALAEALPALVNDVRRSQLGAGIGVLAGLLTDPAFHANTVRIESVIHLLAAHAQGRTKPTSRHVHRWLNQLARPDLVQQEDPVEDVFISNVITPYGNRRLFQGIWHSADFWLQQVLDVLTIMPTGTPFEELRAEVQALLDLSEAVAARVGLPRYTLGRGEPGGEVRLPSNHELQRRAQRVVFSAEDLASRGIRTESIVAFTFTAADRLQLRSEAVGHSTLERRPVVKVGERWVLALPTAASVALRRHVLERVRQWGEQESFAQALQWRQTIGLLNEALSNLIDHPQNAPPVPLMPPEALPADQVSVAFDRGKTAHIVLLHDDLRQIHEEGLSTFHRFRGREVLDGHLVRYAEAIARHADYSGGLTVIVMGGLGRGFALGLPRFPADWNALVISLADLTSLAWSQTPSLLQLWKLCHQSDLLASRGVRLIVTSGFASLLAFWRSRQHRLLDRQLSGQQPTLIHIGGDFLASFRQSLRQAVDTHAASIGDRWITVHKLRPYAFFRELAAKPIYASEEDAQAGRLRGLIETASRDWWVTVVAAPPTSWQRQLAYDIWDATLSWVVKLAPELESRLPELPAARIAVELNLQALSEWDGMSDTLPVQGEPLTTTVDAPSQAVRVTVARSLYGLLARPVNDGERAIVEAIATGVLQIAGREGHQDVAADSVSRVFPNRQGRFVHLFPAQSIRDEIADIDRPEPRFIPDEDVAFAQLGLSTLTENPQAGTIAGTEECNRFLHQVVDALWQRIRSRLGTLNRASVVERCLRNVEGLAVDGDRWNRTAQALLTVYSDRQDVIEAAQERQAARSTAAVATRVLVEMAVCTCPPVGGRPCSTADLDALLADIQTLNSAAYNSDAVKNGLVKAEITIWPNGEYSVPEEFFREVLQPYQDGYFADAFQTSADRYQQLYETPRRDVDPAPAQARFAEAFQAEYGFALEQLGETQQVLEDLARQQQTCVTRTSIRDLLLLVTRDAGMSEPQADSFLSRFLLLPRPKWDKTPKGFEARDWYPWLFRRRLSLLARPLVRLTDDNDAPVLYTAGLLSDGLRYVVTGAYQGRFDSQYFRSAEFQSWVGWANHTAGERFNERVAERFRELGLQARPSVNMTEFGVPTELGDLGDVDVLAWDYDLPVVFTAECKNLKFAMTVREVADQLKRFKGEEKDLLARHLARYEWLRANKAAVARVIRRKDIEFELRPLLVTNTIVPMRFRHNLPLPPSDILPLAGVAGEIGRVRESCAALPRATRDE